MKILDRYLIRETLPPFLLALGMFTFLLAVNPMLVQAKTLLTKGVDLPTVGLMLALLLPQALGVTLPMAFLAGLLMGLGRLSGDREAVALLACGVSPLRLLRPIVILALVVGAADLYVLTTLVPDWNQRFREETYRLVAKMGENDIKPGVFYEGFPGKVLFIRDVRPEGGWNDVMLADTSQPGRPVLTLAAHGRLDLEPEQRQVSIVLTGNPVRYIPGDEEGIYDTAVASELRFAVPAESVFGDGNMMPTRGLAEKNIADLRRAEAAKMAEGAGMTRAEMFTAGLSTHPEVLQRHQMFSFPAACLVFAVMGVALGLHTRREGKLGGFTLGVVVICGYYAVMMIFDSLTRGGSFPAEWARWMPNIVMGLASVLALRSRSRSTGRGFTITLPAWISRAMTTWSAGRSSGSSAPVAGSGRRVVVVIRIPHFDLPRPRILDAYVSRKYLNVAALSFFGLLALYYIGTFIDKSQRLFKGQATVEKLIEYFAYSTPQFVAHLVPMATLVAVLATIGGLTRTGELTVMRACGVSLYRVAAPLLLLALVWSGGLFLLDDRVLGHANRRAELLEDEIRGNPPRAANTIASANWQADADRRIYYYAAFDLQTQTLHALSILEPTRDGSRLLSHTLVRRATFANGTWHADGGWVQRFPAPNRAVREVLTPRTLTLMAPEQFSGARTREVELMTFGDLRQHIASLGQSGLNLIEPRVQLQERLAFPLVTVVMTILGVPFGVSTGRRGTLYGVGLAIILGAGYWLLNTFFLAVGSAGLLSPVMAAWATNALFLVAAVYAMLTVRT